MLNFIPDGTLKKDTEVTKYMSESFSKYLNDKDYKSFEIRNYSYKKEKQIKNCKFIEYPNKPLGFNQFENDVKNKFFNKIYSIYWDNRCHYCHLIEMLRVFEGNREVENEIKAALLTHQNKDHRKNENYFYFDDFMNQFG